MPTGEKLTQVFAEYAPLPEAGAGKSARDGCRDGSGRRRFRKNAAAERFLKRFAPLNRSIQ